MGQIGMGGKGRYKRKGPRTRDNSEATVIIYEKMERL